MRAANLQALTDDIERRWPGVVIYGIGDASHQAGVSDHNEDDMPARNAAQSDPDTRPEHRAIDVMLGPAFTKADADGLVERLVADPLARRRLFYIIWNGRIWSRSDGWVPQAFGGDPHRDHPHISGWAADDENAAPWPAVGDTPEEELPVKIIVPATGINIPGLKPGTEVDAGWLMLANYQHTLSTEATVVKAIAAELVRDTALKAAVDTLRTAGAVLDVDELKAVVNGAVETMLPRIDAAVDADLKRIGEALTAGTTDQAVE